MNYEIVESFSQMVREKGIEKDVLVGIVEETFGMMVRKKYGQEAKFEIIANMDKGDIEIFLEKEVVETVEDPGTQIELQLAREKSGEDLEIGDEFVEIVDLTSFGRRLIFSAKQNLNQRIREIEKEIIYNEYSSAIGDILVGEIYQIRRNEILINHNRNELVLPKSEQIFKERYKKGETIRALLKEVRKDSGNPIVVVSRADSKFLAKLFEIEIPEIYDGIIEIKAIAREPGERSKVAVESHDDRIDAVGACVGMKGVRIHAIVRELNNENIDVINHSDVQELFIARALSPAKPKQVTVDAETKTATVIVPNEQISLAIGRNGQNIRLASKLTGYELNVKKEKGEYDIELTEFKEELGEELSAKFTEAGYSTARQVLDADVEELKGIEGLEEDRIREILEMMEAELEEVEGEEAEEDEVEVKEAAEAVGEEEQKEKEEKKAEGEGIGEEEITAAGESAEEESGETPETQEETVDQKAVGQKSEDSDEKQDENTTEEPEQGADTEEKTVDRKAVGQKSEDSDEKQDENTTEEPEQGADKEQKA
ncbi:MAG: transcription termination factor NusA [Bacteroidota bacterium]